MKIIDLNEEQYNLLKDFSCESWLCNDCPFKASNDIGCGLLETYEEFSSVIKVLRKDIDIEVVARVSKEVESIRKQFQGENNEDN